LQIYSILLNRKAQIFFLLTLLSINK